MITRLVTIPGIKRTISGALDAIALPLTVIPGAESLVLPIQAVSAFFGGTGLIQATKQKTIGKFKLSSLASVFSVLTLIAHAVPSLHPFLPLLQKLAALSGAVAVGSLKSPLVQEVEKTLCEPIAVVLGKKSTVKKKPSIGKKN